VEAVTLDDMRAPLRALAALATHHAGLPAPWVSASTVYPGRLQLSFHHGRLSAFEAWREALGVPPEAVTYTVLLGTGEPMLEAFTEYAGARVELIGYGHPNVPAGGGS
jgi:hypothetical protein